MVNTCLIVYLPVEEPLGVGVDRAEQGEHHHTVPVREGRLGDMSEDELRHLVRRAVPVSHVVKWIDLTTGTYAMPQ